MNREEIITILRELRPAAELVALPNEGALECTYITSHGVFFEWLPLDGWPFYKVNNVDRNELSRIIAKSRQRNLSEIDLKTTWLGALYNTEVGVGVDFLNDFFSPIISLVPSITGEVYVHVRDDAAYFFETRIEFEAELESHLSPKVVRWEDMPDEELARWVVLVTNEANTFPMIEVDG